MSRGKVGAPASRGRAVPAASALLLVLSTSCAPAGQADPTTGEAEPSRQPDPPPAVSIDPEASPDPALLAEYRSEGLSDGQATFAALSHVEVDHQSTLSYAITQSFPTGNSAEMTITVVPDQAGDADATTPVSTTYSESADGDFSFRVEYFIPYDQIPDDVEDEIRGATSGLTAPVAVAGLGGGALRAIAGGDAGIRVIAEGIVRKLVETRISDFLKGLDQGLGSGALLDTLYKALRAGLKVRDALAIGEEHDALMKRIDALEECAKNPTNPVTRRGYQDDPSQKQRILDAIAEARVEIKSNFAVMFLGLINSVGAGLAGSAASRVLGFIIGPGTAWVKQQLRELNEGWIRDLEKLVTPCDPDWQFTMSMTTVGGQGEMTGEWEGTFRIDPEDPTGRGVTGEGTLSAELISFICSVPTDLSGGTDVREGRFPVQLTGPFVMSGQAVVEGVRPDQTTFFELEPIADAEAITLSNDPEGCLETAFGGGILASLVSEPATFLGTIRMEAKDGATFSGSIPGDLGELVFEATIKPAE